MTPIERIITAYDRFFREWGRKPNAILVDPHLYAKLEGQLSQLIEPSLKPDWLNEDISVLGTRVLQIDTNNNPLCAGIRIPDDTLTEVF